MPEIFRSRDCIVFYKGDSYTVAVDDAMVAGGWFGGQGVRWADGSPIDIRMVTYSDGRYGGFLVWGSDEAADDLTAMSRQQPAYRYATIFLGGCLISTSTYERYTYASRTGGGPLVPLTYTIGQFLYFSIRGYWTNEDEATQAGLPFAPAFFTGMCSQVPRADNNWYLGIQTSL